MIYYMTVQRLDGEWEGMGTVLTRSLHTLDNILLSSVRCWVGTWGEFNYLLATLGSSEIRGQPGKELYQSKTKS